MPPSGFVGNDRFQYEITDTAGGKARAWVEVSIINRAPIATADSFAISGAAAVTFAVLANDHDPDGEGIRLTGTFVPPQFGSVENDSYMKVIYKPGPCFVGTDTFQYDVRDDRGAVSRAIVTVSVMNDHKPAAVDDVISTVSGVVTFINVTANDCDPDGEHPYLDVIDFMLQIPQHGTLKRYDQNTLRYVSSPGFRGADTLKYKVRDAAGNFASATVTIQAN